jgi:hypothetical protein
MTSLAEVARELRAIGAAPGETRDARAMPLRPDGIDYGSLLRIAATSSPQATWRISRGGG